MQENIPKMLHDIESIRRFAYQTIIDLIGDYIYREKRYDTHFSLVTIYTNKPLAVHAQELQKVLRKTDTLICVTDNIICVIFDATQNKSYVKAAENLYKTLKHIDYHQQFFIATAFSNDFNKNYLEMINKLFERLKYSVEHKLCNTVVYEDYII